MKRVLPTEHEALYGDVIVGFHDVDSGQSSGNHRHREHLGRGWGQGDVWGGGGQEGVIQKRCDCPLTQVTHAPYYTHRAHYGGEDEDEE